MSSSNRRQYLTSAVLTQALLDSCHDNLENRLEMVVEIELPGGGTIYASDRNKYVGGTFYEALLNFPVISRTVGEWLSSELQFSTLQLELSNADERFNAYLPGGASYGGWIGKSVVVKVGLAEAAGTYTTIFKGKVTDIGGFRRTVKSVVVIARDDYDKINASWPTNVFTEAAYSKIDPSLIGKIVPVIYGDWTTDTEPSPASVPAYVVNGNDPEMHRREVEVTIPVGSPCVLSRVNHDLDNNDPIQFTTTGTLPTPLALATTYYVVNSTADTFEISAVMAGPSINTTVAGTGTHKFLIDPAAPSVDTKFRISDNANVSFDADNVWLKRGEVYSKAPAADIVNIAVNNNAFDLQQNTANLWVDPGDGTAAIAYQYQNGDLFFVKLKGKDLSGYNDNIVWQARDILITYGGVVSGDFDANWATFRDKSTPAENNIAGFKSRVWVGEAKEAMQYALSMLEQVRLEAFIDRNLKIKINSLHFDDWDSTPSYTVKNWDVEKDSFKTAIDERNNFNRAQGFYNFLPDVNENAYQTRIQKNTAAITQTGKAMSKRVEFPNLYKLADVKYQLIEILRLSSATLETVITNLTWRALLKDIGDFISLDVKIGSSKFDEIPCMIREIGYDPDGLKIPVKLWSFLLVPFPGYTPGYAGTVGGYNATITEE